MGIQDNTIHYETYYIYRNIYIGYLYGLSHPTYIREPIIVTSQLVKC